MSNTWVTCAIVMALGFGATACGDKTPTEKASDAGQSAGEAVGDAAKATGEAIGDAAVATGEAVGDAARATGDFLSESKDESVKAAQKTLNGIERKWQDLHANAVPASDEAKADLRKSKDAMAQALADANAKCVAAKDASADSWQKNGKPALDAAVLKAQKLYDDAAAKFASN